MRDASPAVFIMRLLAEIPLQAATLLGRQGNGRFRSRRNRPSRKGGSRFTWSLELESDVDEIFRTAKAGIPNSAFPVPSKPLQPFNQLLIAGRS
jgi:hypothetical protein